MPYFARLNENNVVIFNERVIGVADGDAEGEAFLRQLHGTADRFRFTKYDGTVRGKFAAIGDTFDEGLDRFIAPQPYPSWVQDANYNWQAPVPYPETGRYVWDEATGLWVSPESEGEG